MSTTPPVNLPPAHVPQTSLDDQAHLLGQFIPLHYHHAMLSDRARTGAFREAIDRYLPSGGKALELGGGTGILSHFAARKASKVYCVERNPELFRFARSNLAANPGGERVELVAADAMDYVPPEPVDVVICEMLHSALLREKQAAVMEAFKQNYRARFGPKLPRFIPEAVVLGVQAVQQDFDFSGYHCPLPIFQDPAVRHEATLELSAPEVYAILPFADPLPTELSWTGLLRLATLAPGAEPLERPFRVNALRLTTKAIIAAVPEEQRTIDWYMSHMVLPLAPDLELDAEPGSSLRLEFSYPAGAALDAFARGLSLTKLPEVVTIHSPVSEPSLRG